MNPNTQTKEFSLRDPDGRHDQCAPCGLTDQGQLRGLFAFGCTALLGFSNCWNCAAVDDILRSVD